MAKKQDENEREEAALDDTAPRVYELGFHLDPELPTEEVKKAYQDIRARAEAAGTIVAEGEPEKIALAYVISRQETGGRRDFDSAYFSWIAYEATPEKHDDVIAAAKEDARVIRFIDLTTTKEAVRQAAELRELSQKGPERAKDAEAASDAELDEALKSVTV